jgi:hypothetical protein
MRNGDLGPSRRLIPNASLYRPETDVEEAGIDRLLEAARRREAAARGETAGPWPDEDVEVGRYREFTPYEVGMIVIGVCSGRKMQDIADDIGRTIESCKNRLANIRRDIRPLTHAEVSKLGNQAMHAKAKGGKGKARNRSCTVEEEQRIKRLYGYGHTTAEVCDMTGVSRGVAEHIKKAVPR